MYERILVALDGSEISEEVLPHAEALAEKFGSTLLVTRVNPSLNTSSAAASPPEDPTLVHRLEQEAAHAHLERIAEQLRGKGCKVEVEMPSGRPAEAIVDLAEARRVDLIAMTTHGRGLGRLLFGSVSTEVLRRARCPMLLVRVDESVARAHQESSTS